MEVLHGNMATDTSLSLSISLLSLSIIVVLFSYNSLSLSFLLPESLSGMVGLQGAILPLQLRQRHSNVVEMSKYCSHSLSWLQNDEFFITSMWESLEGAVLPYLFSVFLCHPNFPRELGSLSLHFREERGLPHLGLQSPCGRTTRFLAQGQF